MFIKCHIKIWSSRGALPQIPLHTAHFIQTVSQYPISLYPDHPKIASYIPAKGNVNDTYIPWRLYDYKCIENIKILEYAKLHNNAHCTHNINKKYFKKKEYVGIYIKTEKNTGAKLEWCLALATKLNTPSTLNTTSK